MTVTLACSQKIQKMHPFGRPDGTHDVNDSRHKADVHIVKVS